MRPLIFVPFLLAVALLPASLLAGITTIDFEGFPDGTNLTTQYPGLTFTNATVIGAGISLNEFEFPPYSGTNVAFDDGGPISIAFASPILSFGGYFTYAEPLTLAAFDSTSAQVAAVASLFSNNEAISGDAGSSPNELLHVSFASGISSVTITGDPEGGSFVMDDATYPTPGPTVPEPGSILLLLTGMAALVAFRKHFHHYVSNSQSEILVCPRPGAADRVCDRLHARPPLCRDNRSASPDSVSRDAATLGGRHRVLNVVRQALWLLFCATCAQAVQSITSPTAFPDGILSNTPTVVTVKALVAPDPNLFTTSITLIRLNQQGQAIGSLGQLYDDASHGDETAGDNVYTGQFSFTESNLGVVSLAITAAYRGTLLRYRSSLFSLAVSAPWTSAELQTTTNLQDQAGQYFQSSRGQLGDSAARSALIASLLQQSGVVSAGLSEDNQTVWIKYATGIQGLVFTAPAGTQGGEGRSVKVHSTLTRNSCPGAQAGTAFALIPHPPKNAAVLAPFFDQFSPNDSAYAVAADLSAACFGSVQPVLNESVTVGIMKSLTKYSVIDINTHGGVGFGYKADQVAIATREHYSAQKFIDYHDDFAPVAPSGEALPPRLAMCTILVSGSIRENVICILPDFIRHYAQPAGFPSSIVFVNACNTVGDFQYPVNLSLWNAFQENGAATYLGWRNSVSANFAAPTQQAVFDYLASDPSHTAGAAYQSLSSHVDPTLQEGTYATVNIQGDLNRTLCGLSSQPQSTWTQKFPTTIPPARSKHALVDDSLRGQIVMFGGWTGNSLLDDTWIWDGSNWTQRFPITLPPARNASQLAYDAAHGEVVMFGGNGIGCTECNDTWIWDGSNWTQRFPAKSPPPRFAHAMAYDPIRHRVVLFGGYGVQGLLNDTWIWDGSNWTQVFPPVAPTPRYGSGIAFDGQTQSVVLVGGAVSGLGSTNEVWFWNGNTWTQMSHPNTSSFLFEPMLAYEQQNSRLLLTFSNGSFMETWTWNGSSWTIQTPAASPAVRDNTAIVADPAHGQVVLFGGDPHAEGKLGDTWLWPRP